MDRSIAKRGGDGIDDYGMVKRSNNGRIRKPAGVIYSPENEIGSQMKLFH